MKIAENEGVIYFSYENKHLTEEEAQAFSLWWQAFRQQDEETIEYYLQLLGGKNEGVGQVS